MFVGADEGFAGVDAAFNWTHRTSSSLSTFSGLASSFVGLGGPCEVRMVEVSLDFVQAGAYGSTDQRPLGLRLASGSGRL